MLKAKLHDGKITSCNPSYEGSITIDSELLERAGIKEYEKVLVIDMDNGNRFETYAIKGEKGQIAINGGAAKLCKPGHKVSIFAFALTNKEIKPKILILDGENKIKRVI